MTDHIVSDVVQFASSVHYCYEGAGTVSVAVERHGRVGNKVLVDYTTKDGSAKHGKKYFQESGTLEFAPGERLKTIDIRLVDNDSFDSILEFDVVLSNPRGAQVGLYNYKCMVMICDEDAFPTNKFKSEIKENAPLDWRILIEYFKMNLREGRFKGSILKALIIDQMMNFRYIFEYFWTVYLLDNVLGEGETTAPADAEVPVMTLLLLLPHFTDMLLSKQRAALNIPEKAAIRVQENLMRKFLYFGSESRDIVTTSDLTMAMLRDIPDISQMAWHSVLEMFQTAGRVIVFNSLLFHSAGIQWEDLVFMVICILFFPATIFGFLHCRQKEQHKRRGRMQQSQTNVVELIQQVEDCYRTIADYLRRPLMIRKFNHFIEDYNRACSKLTQFQVINENFAPLIGKMVLGLFLLTRYKDILNDRITFGHFVADMAVLIGYSGCFARIYANFCEIQHVYPPLYNIVFYMNLHVEIPERMKMHEKHLSTSKEKQVHANDVIWGESVKKGKPKSSLAARSSHVFAVDLLPIKGNGLAFGYPNSGKKIINGADFAIPQGKLVALIGPRSSGKATLLQIIGGLRQPDVEHTFFMPPHLRVLHVSHEFQIIPGITLFENLCLGAADHADEDPERVLTICKRLGMSESILSFIRNDAKMFTSEISYTPTNDSADSRASAGSADSQQPLQKHRHMQGSADSLARRRLAGMQAHTHHAMTETDKYLVHIARALVMNPEVLILHKPLEQFNDGHRRLVMGVLREFVDLRGVEQEADKYFERRPRTCIFSVNVIDYTELADIVLRIDKGKIEHGAGLTPEAHLRHCVRVLFQGLNGDGEGMVDMKDFVNGAAAAPFASELLGITPQLLDDTPEEVRERMRAIFNTIDRDGSGSIDQEALADHLWEKLQPQLEYLLAGLDQAGAGAEELDKEKWTIPDLAWEPELPGTRHSPATQPSDTTSHSHAGGAHSAPTSGIEPLALANKLDDPVPQVLVPDPCMRGMTLDDLIHFFETYCGELAFEDGEKQQQPVCIPSTLLRMCNTYNIEHKTEIANKKAKELTSNLYAVNTLLIKPLTKSLGVSFSEFLHPKGALIKVFISHWWGEDFGEFVQSTFRYTLHHITSTTRTLNTEMITRTARNITFYVCAFSNNQWNIKAEMGNSVEDSPFYRILLGPSTEFVVMNVDMAVNTLLRAWCCFEFFLSHKLQKPFVLNCRFGPLKELPIETKVVEIWCVHLFKVCMDMDIRSAQASRAKDLEMILGEIDTFEAPKGSPFQGLKGGDALNMILKSHLAAQVLPFFAKLGKPMLMKEAIDLGADPNSPDHLNVRPLTYSAALHGEDHPATQVLKDHAADVRALVGAKQVVEMFDTDGITREKAIRGVYDMNEDDREFFSEAVIVAEQRHNLQVLHTRLENLHVVDHHSRLAALEIIARCRQVEDELAQGISRCLRDEHDPVRFMAAVAMSKCGPGARQYQEPLKACCKDPDPGVRLQAQRACAILGIEGVCETFSPRDSSISLKAKPKGASSKPKKNVGGYSSTKSFHTQVSFP